MTTKRKRATPKAVLAKFSEDELQAVRLAALAVWQYGHDVFSASKGKDTLSRAEVIELVAHAGRLEDHPAPVGGRHSLGARSCARPRSWEARGGVAGDAAGDQHPRSRPAAGVRKPPARIIGRPARRAAVPGSRLRHHDEHLPAKHAAPAGAGAREPGSRRVRTPFAHGTSGGAETVSETSTENAANLLN